MQKRKIADQLGLEKNDRLGSKTTVFGASKRQHINACLPGHLGRRHSKRHEGIGKTGAVHVHAEIVAVRHRSNRLNFFDRINRARLAGLGNTDTCWLGMMHVSCPIDGLFERLRGDAPVRARHIDELGPARKQLRSAALIGIDVRQLVTEDLPKRRRQRRQRQCVSCRTGRDWKHRNGCFKNLPKPCSKVVGPRIFTI